MNRLALLVLTAIAAVALRTTPAAQAKHYPLDSTVGLRLHNVAAEPAVLQGKKGLRVTHSEEAQRRLQSITPDEQARFPQLASIDGLEFANGAIEAELAATTQAWSRLSTQHMGGATIRIELLPGTLDLLILRTLVFGPSHGHAIAKQIRRTSDDVLRIETGSLYPALHRLETRGWISSEWRISDKGKRARYYQLTRSGRKQLVAVQSKWEQLSMAIARVLRPAE